MTFAERLAGAVKASPLNAKQIANRIVVTPSAVYQMRSGKTKSAKLSNLFAISDALGVEARWLATGRGTMKQDTYMLRQIREIAAELEEDKQRETLFFVARKTGTATTKGFYLALSPHFFII